MVVNLNPAVKAKINQASSIVPPPVKPTVQPTTVVSWWPIETANALKNITQPATSPIPSSTTNTTTPTTWLPVKSTVTAPTTTPTPVKSGLPIFGTTASQQNATDNTYLDTRNTWLATDYSAKGIKDKESIYNELSKNADFAAATEEDKQHTADEIFKKMGTVQPTDTTTTPIKTDDIPAATDTYATLSEAEQNNPWLSTLSETEKQAYAMMSDIEKKQFINIGRNDLKNTATYIARRKEAKQYATDTNAIQTDIRNNQWEINDIQSSTRLRQAWQQLDNLKKNIAYLGTMWAPGVSTQRMDAVGKQLAEGEKIYADLVRTEKLQKEMFDSGSTLTAMQMEREMQTLQDQLDDKVGKAMQDAMAWLSAADIKWQLDTVEEIDAFRKNLVTSLDNTITGITDDNIKARQFLIERFDKIWQDMRTDIENKQKAQVEYQKNANTVNVDMSAAQWFYTDWNGNAIIDKATWAPIKFTEKPLYTTYSPESGMLVTVTKGKNGELISNAKQISQPIGKAITIKVPDWYWGTTDVSVMQMADGSIQPINFNWWWQTNNTTNTQSATDVIRDTISRWEWFREDAYKDSGGKWTVWYGFTTLDWRPVKEGDHITREAADTLLDQKIWEYQNWRNKVTVDLSPSQQAALTSFEYNLWKWIWDKSANNILDMVNKWDLSWAANAMKAYNKAGWVEIKWLNNRRVAEAQMIQDKWTVQQDKFNPVVDTILWSGKFTKDQSAAIRRSISSWEDPATVIKNQAKWLMESGNATKVEWMETAKQQIQSIQTLLKDYYSKGWKTWIFEGNYEKVLNSLWDINNPDLVNIATQIASALQVYRNAVSGTAYSEKEWQDIASIFPWINKSQWLNDAVINWRLAAFNTTIDWAYRNVLWSAYDKLVKWWLTNDNQSNNTNTNTTPIKAWQGRWTPGNK